MLNLEAIKELISSNKKDLALICLLLYLGYQLNAKNDVITQKDKDNQELLKKCQMDASEQLKRSREQYEQELNAFVVSSNKERDSIYRFFYKKYRSLNKDVTQNL